MGVAVSIGAPFKPQVTPDTLLSFHKSSCANGCNNLRGGEKGNGKDQVSQRWACKPRGRFESLGDVESVWVAGG